MGILHHRGFREAFLEDGMPEESGGAENKSIPGMQWGASPRSCDDSYLQGLRSLLGRSKREGTLGEGVSWKG